MILPEGNRLRVRAVVTGIRPRISEVHVCDRVGGAALFSATLAPMDHYARQLGLDAGGRDTMLRLESPFPPENLLDAAGCRFR